VILVLDTEAVSNLRSPNEKHVDSVRAAIQVAIELKRPVLVPAVVLAELYRGARQNASLDALLNREGRLLIKDSDRVFARFVGGVLAAAGADSTDMADAHCVATAVERGGGVILTGDPTDMIRLAASYSHVTVAGL
jgi:predicted nucleic acid-binding protein